MRRLLYILTLLLSGSAVWGQVSVNKPDPPLPVGCVKGSELACDPTGIGGDIIDPTTGVAINRASPSAWMTAVRTCTFTDTVGGQATYTYSGGGTQTIWCPATLTGLQTFLNVNVVPGDTIVTKEQGPSSSVVYSTTNSSTCTPSLTNIGQTCLITLPAQYNPSNKWTTIMSSGLGSIPTGARVIPGRDKQHLSVWQNVQTAATSHPTIGMDLYANYYQIAGLELSLNSTYSPVLNSSPWTGGRGTHLVFISNNWDISGVRALSMTTGSEIATLGRAFGFEPSGTLLFGFQCTAAPDANCSNRTNHSVDLTMGATTSITAVGNDTQWQTTASANLKATLFSLGTGITVNSAVVANVPCASGRTAQILTGTCQTATLNVTVTPNAIVGGTGVNATTGTAPVGPAHSVSFNTYSTDTSTAGNEYMDLCWDCLRVVGPTVPTIISFVNTTAGPYFGTNAVPFTATPFSGTITTANMSDCAPSGPACTVTYTLGGGGGSSIGFEGDRSQPTAAAGSVSNDNIVNVTMTFNTLQGPNGSGVAGRNSVAVFNGPITTATPKFMASDHSPVMVTVTPGATSWIDDNDVAFGVVGESYLAHIHGHNTHWTTCAASLPTITAMSLPGPSGPFPDATVTCNSIQDATHATITISSPSDQRVKLGGPDHIKIYQSWIHGSTGIMRVNQATATRLSTPPYNLWTANNACPAGEGFDGATAGFTDARTNEQFCLSMDGAVYIDDNTTQELVNGINWGGHDFVLENSVIGPIFAMAGYISENHGIWSNSGSGPALFRNDYIENNGINFFLGSIGNPNTHVGPIGPNGPKNIALINLYTDKPDWWIPIAGDQTATLSQANYTLIAPGGVVTGFGGSQLKPLHSCPGKYTVIPSTGSGLIMNCTWSAGTLTWTVLPDAAGHSGGSGYTDGAAVTIWWGPLGNQPNGYIVNGHPECPGNNSTGGNPGTCNNNLFWTGFKNHLEYKSCVFCLIAGTITHNNVGTGITGYFGVSRMMQPLPQGWNSAQIVRHSVDVNNWHDMTWEGVGNNYDNRGCSHSWATTLGAIDSLMCYPPESNGLNYTYNYAGGAGYSNANFFSGNSDNARMSNILVTVRDRTDGQADTSMTLDIIGSAKAQGWAITNVDRDMLTDHSTFIMRPGAVYNPLLMFTWNASYLPWSSGNGSSEQNEWITNNASTCTPSGQAASGFTGLINVSGCYTNTSSVYAQQCNQPGAFDVYQRITGNVFAEATGCSDQTTQTWTQNGANNFATAGSAALGFANASTYVQGKNPGNLSLTSPAYGTTGGKSTTDHYITTDTQIAGVNIVALNNAIINVFTGQPPTCTGLCVTPQSIGNGAVGENDSITIGATGGTGVYLTWTCVATCGLPAGYSLNTLTGVITGAGASIITAGTYNFSITVTDSGSVTSPPQLFTITINTRLTAVPATLPTGTVNVPYSATLNSTGGLSPVCWQTTALPPGIILAPSGCPSGAIAGTPTAVGTTTFTAQAKDAGITDCIGANAQACALYSITIGAGFTYNSPTSIANMTSGTPIAPINVMVSSGTPPYTYSPTTTGWPLGIALDATTGVISGSTTALGSYSQTITVTDNAGGSVNSGPLPFQVVSGTTPLTVDTTVFPNATFNVAYLGPLAAHGGTGTGYTWLVISGALPPGLGIVGQAVSGIPALIGVFSPIVVQVTDSGGNTASSGNLSITVQPPPPTLNIDGTAKITKGVVK